MEMKGLLQLMFSCYLVAFSLAVFVPEETRATRRFNQKRSRQWTCPSHCYCSSDTLKCKFQQTSQVSLSKIPSNIETLQLTNWPFEDANSTLFQDVTNLRWLRINKGKLLTFPSIDTISKLSYIDLSQNFIWDLPSSAFANNSYVAHLNLSYNSIQSISSDFFYGLAHLRILDLSHNPSIKQLSLNIFSSCCGNLRYLDLSTIGINDVSSDLIHPLQELEFLNISRNELSSVPAFNLPNLKIFDASYNPITVLPKLAGLRNLRELYLSHTFICYLNAQETKGCNHLQIIDISYANLTNINEDVLSNCQYFQEINLSHNYNLYRIEHGALSGLSNLTILKLNNCPKLTDLEDDMFNGLTNLKEVHLEESGIQLLPSSLFKLDNLSYVNLESTTLFCNCYGYQLKNLVNNSNPHISSWKGLNPIQCHDGVRRTPTELDLHLKEKQCQAIEVYSESNLWVLTAWAQSVLLECNVTGNPEPNIVWLTVDNKLLVHNNSATNSLPWISHHLKEVLQMANAPTEGKFQVLESGQLLIKDVQRADIGRYKCFAFNAVSNSSVVTLLGIKDIKFRSLVIESILFGFACAALFLLITLLTQFIKFIMERFGLECCCCKNRLSPKAKQIRQLIESVESYKTAQLDRLKDNYNSQVLSIKDSCFIQMERLRDSYTNQSKNLKDSYTNQSKNLKDLCDYSTQQITGARDQYIDQVNKVRDYSMGQMNRVRENYVFQRHRIRKFSGNQLLKLRETYKYQQKTLNKLLETLPDIYIQNCRTGSCQRTDSMIFEEEIDGLDIYFKLDFLETHSLSSDYYTPSSTLTRQSKKHKVQAHTRNDSGTSGGTEYQEANSWIIRQASMKSDKIIPVHKRFHVRSFSLAGPATLDCQHPDSDSNEKGHKRSISASSHPSPQVFSPKPPLLEEPQDTLSAKSVEAPGTLSPMSSEGTPFYHTPMTLTPVHDYPPTTLEISAEPGTSAQEYCDIEKRLCDIQSGHTNKRKSSMETSL